MTAIANVKVIESMIEVPAAQYRKVDRDAKVGDVIRFDDESSFVTRGGFYEVVRIDGAGDPQILDNDGDEYDLAGDDYEVYEKVTEAAAQESDDLFTYEGVQYRKVKRKAAVGERVLIVANTNYHRYKNGEVVVGKGRYEWGGDKVGIDTNEAGGQVRDTDYVVLEPVISAEPPARIPVGSYVKIAVDTEDLPKGAVAKVTEDSGSGDKWPYRCELLNGSNYDWFNPEQIEVMSEDDAKTAVEAEAERAKWAAIGREVGEYKAGDVVMFMEDTGASKYPKGSIAVIDEIENGEFTFGNIFSGEFSWCKLIAPVEQRFDRTEAMEAAGVAS